MKTNDDPYLRDKGCERKAIVLLLILFCMVGCAVNKYTPKHYEKDRKQKGCPAYGFNRIDNKYNYFHAPRLYQQTYSYKYGPWK